MTALCHELTGRFPELRKQMEFDAELPYLLMHHLADWIVARPPRELAQGTVNRIASFVRWCEEQPRTADADTDIYTILVVGFIEELFATENGRALLPKLVSREDIAANESYLKVWVGEEDYQKARARYGRESELINRRPQNAQPKQGSRSRKPRSQEAKKRS